MISLANAKYFTWQGRKSTDSGIIILENGVNLRTPPVRSTEIYVPGNNDVIFNEQGFSAYDVQIKIAMVSSLTDVNHGNDAREEVNKFFFGETNDIYRGKLQFSWEDKYYYEARLLNGLDIEHLLQYRTGTVTFRVQPLKRLIFNSPPEAEYQFPFIDHLQSHGQRSMIDGSVVTVPVSLDVFNSLSRTPKFYLDITQPTSVATFGFVDVSIWSNGTGKYVGRKWSVQLSRLKVAYPDASILVFDFENDDYLICKDDPDYASWGDNPEGKNYVTEFTREKALGSLVPYMFTNYNTADIMRNDDGTLTEVPQKLWHEITFNGGVDYIKVDFKDSNGNSISTRYPFFYAPEVRLL